MDLFSSKLVTPCQVRRLQSLALCDLSVFGGSKSKLKPFSKNPGSGLKMSGWARDKENFLESPHIYSPGQSSALADYVGPMKVAEGRRVKYVPNLYKRRTGERLKYIELMKRICEELSLSHKSLHHGVYIYDRFMAVHTIGRTQQHLMAVTCLLLAAKLEEPAESMPTIGMLRFYFPRKADRSAFLYRAFENYVLGFFNFSILTPTVAEFLEIFFLVAIEPQDIGYPDDSGTVVEPKAEEMKYMREAIRAKKGELHPDMKSCLDSILTSEPTEVWNPSLVAAAIVSLIRSRHGNREWTQNLQIASGYSTDQVRDCVVLYLREICEPNFAPFMVTYPIETIVTPRRWAVKYLDMSNSDMVDWS